MLKGPPVEAVVLDMDGVLIDSEPVWRAAQSAVFAGFGVALSEGDLLDSTGQPIEELIPVWRRRAPGQTPPALSSLTTRSLTGSSTRSSRT